ncbi:MAG TPA: hypothetical protein VFT48_03960 [Pyrinomonadaceae bacterium]|nr:hypothetical protein [Pyrinomonadaceae bacterium]
MIKVHRIIRGTALLAVCGFMMIIWAHGRPEPPLTQASLDSISAVKLRFTFASGDSANVTQVEGGTIKVEKDRKKLTITPYKRDNGQVELRVFQAVQREGKEMMEAVDTLLVDKGLTKLNRGNLPFSVQVIDADKKLPAASPSAPGTCCATTCAGTVVCGVCVCTDCGRCGPRWCDCAAP